MKKNKDTTHKYYTPENIAPSMDKTGESNLGSINGAWDNSNWRRDAVSLFNSTDTQIGGTITVLEALNSTIDKLDEEAFKRLQPHLDKKLTVSLAPLKEELETLKSRLEPLGDSLKRIDEFIQKDTIMLTNSIEYTGRLNSLESQIPSITTRIEKLETDKDKTWNRWATIAWIIVTVLGVVVAYYVGLQR
jgi:hypothetical protein